MESPPSPVDVPVWALLRDARQRAGLTQRKLAERADTSQSAIARYERARTLPDLYTLRRLLAACGFELRWELRPLDLTPERQIRDALALTPRERLDANTRMMRLARKAQAARSAGSSSG